MCICTEMYVYPRKEKKKEKGEERERSQWEEFSTFCNRKETELSCLTVRGDNIYTGITRKKGNKGR